MKCFKSLDFYLLINPDLIIQSFSKNIPSIWQDLYFREIEPGQDLAEFIPQAMLNDFREIVAKELDEGSTVLKRLITFPSGRSIDILATLSPIEFDGKRPYILIRINNTLSYQAIFLNQREILSRYAYVTSHKLRSPLTNILSISNSISDMKETEFEPAIIKQLLEDISHQAQCLDEIIYTLNDLIRQDEGQKPNPRELASQKINTIFLVDDDSLVNKIHQKIINNYWPEISIKSFTDGAEALQAISKDPPDLIMLDINMPIINGWQFLNALLHSDIDIDVVMLSSSIDPEEKKKAFTFSNVKHFFNKPLIYDQLNLLLKTPGV